MNPELSSSAEAAAPAEELAGSTMRAVLDTTIQLDRCKTASRREHLNSILAGFDFRFSTSMSLVEFKATIIQECITIHNQLRRTGARFTRVRDALLEKNHPQHKLRTHIFNNLIDVHVACNLMAGTQPTAEQDQRLAEKARLNLENIIPRLYAWFVEESVDAVLDHVLQCDRAREPPRKKQAAFDTNLPICRRGVNKGCSVEEVLRREAPSLLPPLRRLAQGEDAEQFQKTIRVIEKAVNDPEADLTHGDCRGAGDTLIILEAREKATHALSTNAREWSPLAELMKLTFVRVTYPDETTH